jgi:hypothetical protein
MSTSLNARLLVGRGLSGVATQKPESDLIQPSYLFDSPVIQSVSLIQATATAEGRKVSGSWSDIGSAKSDLAIVKCLDPTAGCDLASCL